MPEHKAQVLKGGGVLYKCRLCQTIWDAKYCKHIGHAAVDVIRKGVHFSDELPGITIGMYDLHICDDGRVGISDLQGFNPDKDRCKMCGGTGQIKESVEGTISMYALQPCPKCKGSR